MGGEAVKGGLGGGGGHGGGGGVGAGGRRWGPALTWCWLDVLAGVGLGAVREGDRQREVMESVELELALKITT